MFNTIFHYSLWLCLWLWLWLWLCLWLWLLDMFGGTKRCRGWLKWWIISTLNAYLKNHAVFSSFASSANFRLSLHVRWSFTLPPPFLNSLESKRHFFLNGLYSSEVESSELESRCLFYYLETVFFLILYIFFLILCTHLN